MSEGKIRQWCRSFKNGRKNMQGGKPTIQTTEIVEQVNGKLQNNRP